MVANALAAQPASSTPAWHATFLRMLPAIREQLRFAFRGLRAEERAEATADCIANIALQCARLSDQGKLDLAFPSILARYAIAHYFAGRRTGSPLNINDALSPYARRCRGFTIQRLDVFHEDGGWREILVEDHRSTPAELAASRIDFEHWLHRLPASKRQIASTLARGETTQQVAHSFALSNGRISQLRRELEADWHRFQGEPAVCD